MILVDTGPLVALFNAKDNYHSRCLGILQALHEPLLTTIPVLTEAFHLLVPGSKRVLALGAFVQKKGITVWSLDDDSLITALLLMEKYADKPMDFADASLVTAAQLLDIQRIFTIDRNDFLTYRIASGHTFKSFELIN
jgi:predicted nucleic acid-binding protein